MSGSAFILLVFSSLPFLEAWLAIRRRGRASGRRVRVSALAIAFVAALCTLVAGTYYLKQVRPALHRQGSISGRCCRTCWPPYIAEC